MLFRSVVVLTLGLGSVAPVLAQDVVFPPKWEERAFEDVEGPQTQKMADYLNQECAPRDLSGIQMFAIQGGHNQRFNLHIYCRKDKAPKVHYSVELRRIGKGQFNQAAVPVLGDKSAKIGPFYFGNSGEQDGMLILRKDK
ncbi:hypothetical protein EOE18_16935 [Novosphingobium umbonatum]|uniref:Uncharacterized protein n=1 Tax=Novosphingobium umbonatum TaxID=1908524 RepID=A0A3S2Y6E2_9SPHN|nr:hypothetical protein [Novosphingobium umbonatum]RVU03220.1 hypothetical protein EOE18_16935 [Novosphingobium umbonatum]